MNREVTISCLSQESLLFHEKAKYDYIDSYAGEVLKTKVSPMETGISFISSSPKWVEKLFGLRNKIVGLFGLKTGGEQLTPEEIIKAFKAKKGQKLGFFEVFDSNERELILGENDKHLDFKVSILNTPISEDSSLLTITTLVEFHNWFGKLYFFPVQPFHKIIVPRMLKGIIKQLENDH